MKTTFTILFFVLGINLFSNAATKNLIEITTTVVEKTNSSSNIQCTKTIDEIQTAPSESQQYPRRPRHPKRPFKGNELYYIGGVAAGIFVVGVVIFYVLTGGQGISSR